MKKRIVPLLLTVMIFLGGCGNVDDSVQDKLYDELSQYYQVEKKDDNPPLTAFTLPILQGQTLDPITCPDGAQQTLGNLLYESLFALNPQFALENVLAESYSYDAATFTYTITLRSGVSFSDGSLLTAYDVVNCLQRARSSVRYAARLSAVSSLSAGDESTVYIRLRSANSSFASRLDIPIVKSGTEKQLVPLGTGPYCYQAEEGGHACLRSNENWWQKQSLPLQRIELRSVKDNDTMAYTFYSREVQLLNCDLTATTSANVSGGGNYTDADTATMLYIGINTTRQPLQDAAVRQALNLGLDRVGCVNSFLMGHGATAQFPLSPVCALYPKDSEINYSPDHFVQAAEKAGITKGNTHSLSLLVNEESTVKVSMAQKIATELSSYDLKISVDAVPWESYLSALNRGQFDLYLGECKLTADWDLTPLLLPGGALNYGGFSDPAITALVQQYLNAADDTTRQNTMHTLCQKLQQQAPILPICFKRTSVLLTAGAVEVITPTACNPFYGLSEWKVNLHK